MIQAFGLTSNARKEHPPAVDDVSFEARAGRVTALLGAPGAGKTAALRLMLELQQGRGITYFRGRPLHRIAHPSREVGVLLGDVPGHPARSVRGHLRMLCAAAGVPARRADEVLEVVGLVSLRDERLGSLARGMDRRLGLACALLSDPHTLVLDEPADELSARESRWLYGMLRAHAAQGGTVLFTTAEPKEAARCADRVVTLEQGRLVADQEAGEFARTRLRPRVAVRSPHAARLAALLTKEARTAHRSVEVVREDGNRLSVYGSTCADVGETAFRHDILVHQLADEIGDMGPGAGALRGEGPESVEEPRVPDTPSPTEIPTARAKAPLAEPRTTRTDTPLAEPSAPRADTPFAESPAPRTDASPAQPPTPRTDAPLTEPLTPRTDVPLPQPLTRLTDAPHAEMPTPRADTPLGELPAGPADAPSTDMRAAEGSQPHADAPQQPHSAASLSTTTPTAEPPVTAEPQPVAEPHPPHEAHAPAASPSTANSRLVALIDPEESAGTHPRARAARPAQALTLDALSPLPPPISVRSAPSPLRPLRYELRRAAGIGTGFLTGAAVLVVSVLTALFLARIGHTPQPRLLAAWPRELPLPPAALGAGLLGAFAFGDEFRHPALAADRGTVPRRMGLLVAKLLVSAATALLLAFLTVGCDAEALYLVYGRELAQVPADWLSMSASWIGLVVGCAWAGVLAAGIFRSTTAGLAAVVAVPILVVPLVHKALEGPAVRTAEGFPLRMRKVFLLQWPFGGERYLSAAARVIAQPVGGALTLSLTALLCAYLLTTLRGRVR
ncbi:ATP-binding cassette domain-containing protein [Streptomyces sp. NBC_01239]|uniref:ABC transporter ATP-binding protein n=1 Tax=Streptomyces sp. NBC_01239 TaxID=2903792 RepID=UPI00224FE078|nr:ATP-binding cassette domain-containing protein [Streptomyces sp. NBC_01239]MCX4814379.1 ATP-binding cassette domain-containing protein [Streptomyces sp. NBC_01239]